MPVKKVKAAATTNNSQAALELEQKVNLLEKEISRLNEALSKALTRLSEVERLASTPASCVDKDLRKKLAVWNPKLGKKI